MSKPLVLHCGDAIKWNHDLYAEFEKNFTVKRIGSVSRADFITALKNKTYGDFDAIYRPFWNTGGEMSPWNDELISLLPKSCKIYTSAGAGFDWVDTKALAKRGIIYCNAASACTESVADAAIWLILSTFRLFSWSSVAARSLDEAQFVDANKNTAAITSNPSGQTVGIIGMGQIGYRIAKKARAAFDMKVVYNDVIRKSREIEDSVGAQFYDKLDDMLAVADVTIVATPFGGDKVVNAEHFKKMKKGSRLVNIARGKLVDEEGLVEALESGHLYAAGLDVHYWEPKVNAKLAKMRNVEMLSHTAGASLDSHIGFERLGMENIMSFFSTGKAITPVNAHLIDQAKL
ncbi:hypothetical protein MBLNU459_g5830t1 [Dothideomycetes sp. NU459]